MKRIEWKDRAQRASEEWYPPWLNQNGTGTHQVEDLRAHAPFSAGSALLLTARLGSRSEAIQSSQLACMTRPVTLLIGLVPITTSSSLTSVQGA